jgi:6-phosphogluconolactonase
MSSIKTAIFEDADSVASDVARRFIDIASASVNRHGRFIVALAGGSTPKHLYQLLATDELRNQVDWNSVHAFLGDERYVPLDHDDSNFRMAQESLARSVPIPEQQVYPVQTDREPADAACAYEEKVREVFDAPAGEIPAFDLILLGIGGDGHTASLFPNTDALSVTDRLVVENLVPQQDAMRITFTAPLLQAARETIVMATGQDKADAVARAVQGDPDLSTTPSQLLRESHGSVMFALDRAAASALR